MQTAPGKDFRTIWPHPDDPGVVQIIDQRQLPHHFVVHDLKSCADGAAAIREMLVRGAPLIGATAAWSLYLAAVEARETGLEPAAQCNSIRAAAATLGEARPTAVNLRWAIERCLKLLDSAHARDELEKPFRRHLSIEGGALGQVPDPPLHFQGRGGHIVAGDDRGSRAGGEKTGDHFHRRRFAGSVRAQKAQHLAAVELKAQSLNGMNVTVASMKVRDLDQAPFAHGALLFAAPPRIASTDSPAVDPGGALITRFSAPK